MVDGVVEGVVDVVDGEVTDIEVEGIFVAEKDCTPLFNME